MNSTAGSRLGRFASEVAVIVLGVLIALFAESAWAERGERAEERQVLERMAGELAEDSVAVAGLAGWVGVVDRSTLQARSVLEGDDALAAPARLANLYVAGTSWTFASPTITWDELVQSGRLTLVEDADVRRFAVRYHDQRAALLQDVRMLQEDAYRRRIVSMLPSEFTYTVLIDCFRNPALDPGYAGVGPEITLGANDRVDRCGVVPEGGSESWLRRVRSEDGLDRDLGDRAYRLRIIADQIGRVDDSRAVLRNRLRELGFEASR